MTVPIVIIQPLLTMVATVVVMVVLIPNLTILIQINLREQKAGKIEVMEIPLKMQNMKVVGVEEKGEFQMITIPQTLKISNPSLQVLMLIQEDT